MLQSINVFLWEEKETNQEILKNRNHRHIFAANGSTTIKWYCVHFLYTIQI